LSQGPIRERSAISFQASALGEIVSTAALRKITGDFLNEVKTADNISANQKVLRPKDEEIRIALCRLIRKGSPG
jgi:hypothetical protein